MMFRRARVEMNQEIVGRIGTSCYGVDGKVYIFGGFY